jgi:hypothetical protein
MPRSGLVRLPGLIALIAIAGCGDKSSPPASTATATFTTSEQSKNDAIRITPRKDLAEVIALSQFEYDVDNPQQQAVVMEWTGEKAMVVHLMIYQDQSWSQTDAEPERKERSIFQYDLIPIDRIALEPGIGHPRGGKPVEPYGRTVDHLLVIDLRRDLVQLSLRQKTGFTEGEEILTTKVIPGAELLAVNSSSGKRTYARRYPDQAHRRNSTIIDAADVKSGLWPHVGFFHSSVAGDSTYMVRQIPLELKSGKSESIATFETRAGQVDVSIEHLPFSAALTDETFQRLAEEYREQAVKNPKDVAARYYFAWATRFAMRKDGIGTARKFLEQAQAMEPNNRALTALRAEFAVMGVLAAAFDDEATALKDAKELLGLHPTALACETAAYGLARNSQRSPERMQVIEALLREALTLDSAAPALMPERLNRWRNRFAKELIIDKSPLNQLLEEFAKPRL